MDSSQEGTGLAHTTQEAANLAQIRSYRLNIWMVVLAVIQIIIAVLSIWRPQSIGGTVMLSAWLPIILLLLSAAITITALLIVSAQRLQTKRLAKLQQVNAAKVDSLLDEKQGLAEELSRRDSEKKALQRQLDEAQETIKQLERERDTFQSELVTEKKGKHDVDESLEISRRELDNVKLQLQTVGIERETLKLEFDALQKELTEAKRSERQANLRANEEINQKNEFYKLYKESEHKLSDLRWLEGRMKQQAEKLDTWVRIKKANRVNLQLTTTPRRVIIAFWVKNNSIFTVTFNLKFITGYLRFKGNSLHDPIRSSKRRIPIEDLEPGACLEIILVQPLLRTEAETILDARQNGDPNAIFSLVDLNIPISIRNIPQEVAAAKLKIHPEIEFMEASDFPCDINADEIDIS